MSELLEADELYRFFRSGDEEIRALRGVSLTVAIGEVLAVAGPSGSGKSTLLACLAGLDEPSGGVVRVDGERVSGRSEGERAQIRRRRVGVLLQHGNLLPHLTVSGNVRLVQQLVDAPQRDMAVLDRLGLSQREHALPAELSGGEAARAGLAVALASRPSVVLADEPTGELDAEAERQVLDLLKATADTGVAVLVVTHSSRVMNGADRIIRMVDGAVTA